MIKGSHMRFYYLPLLMILSASFAESFGSTTNMNGIVNDCENCEVNNFHSPSFEDITKIHEEIVQAKLQQFYNMSFSPSTSNLYDNPFYSQSFEMSGPYNWTAYQYKGFEDFGNWSNFPEIFQLGQYDPVTNSKYSYSIVHQPEKSLLQRGPIIQYVNQSSFFSYGQFGEQSEFFNFSPQTFQNFLN